MCEFLLPAQGSQIAAVCELPLLDVPCLRGRL